ncbi:TonB-dependent siderophore receptor [Steroidobacter flavus]|uniref:TonB-dependent siderophore receptor n=1 Tax=Steroidobacter flavus TaxID=1842136 RepID=A0ABV8SLK1_9GAMM
MKPIQNVSIARAVSLALLLAGSAHMNGAFAQSTSHAASSSDQDRELLETITVEAERARSVYTGISTTGTKSTTPLNETPQAITVITSDWMEMQNIQNVEDALRYAAGVKTSPYGNDPRNDTFFIRGFNQTTSGLYRDGLTTPNGQYGNWRSEPFALERVEVLRGPSSMLYGANSPGGLVNQMSKRPTAKPVANFQVEYGSFESKQAGFDLGGAVNADETVLVRGVGVLRDAETQVDFVDNKRKYLMPAVTFRPSDKLIWTLLGEYQVDELGKANAYPTRGILLPNVNGRVPTNRFVGEPSFDNFDRDQVAGTSLLTWHLADALTLRQNTRFANMKLDYQTVNPAGLQANQRFFNRQAVVSKEDTDILTTDTTLEGKWSHGIFDHTVVVGVDYQKKDLDYRIGMGTAPALDLFTPTYGVSITRPAYSTFVDQTVDQLGFYAQEHLKIADHFVVLLGGRYDQVERETNTAKDDQSEFTYRVGLVYLTDNGFSPYVSYATSFTPLFGTNLRGESYDPESGEQVEVGLKYQPVGKAVSFTLAAFDLRRQNIQTADPNDPLNTVQSGEIASKGVEFETSYSIGNIDLVASAAYNDVEITKSNNGDQGRTPFGVPDVYGSIWAHYEFEQGPIQGLGFGGGVRYVGKSPDSTNTVESDASTLLDLMASYTFGKWRVALNGTNVLDKTYVSAVFNANTYAYYGNRRAWTLGLNYSY